MEGIPCPVVGLDPAAGIGPILSCRNRLPLKLWGYQGRHRLWCYQGLGPRARTHVPRQLDDHVLKIGSNLGRAPRKVHIVKPRRGCRELRDAGAARAPCPGGVLLPSLVLLPHGLAISDI